MTNFIEKLKKAAEHNGLLLDISGSKKTKTIFRKHYENPYKIISNANVNDKKLFLSLFDYLVQNKKGNFISHSGGEYNFVFIEGDFKIDIQKRNNNVDIICIYKLNN